MRRLLAILLVAVFGFTTAAPLLAATQDPDAHLAACCRRAGAHHCMMLAATGAPAVSARCPDAPKLLGVLHATQVLILATRNVSLRTPLGSAASLSEAEQQRRLSRERTRQTRGPPTDFLVA